MVDLVYSRKAAVVQFSKGSARRKSNHRQRLPINARRPKYRRDASLIDVLTPPFSPIPSSSAGWPSAALAGLSAPISPYLHTHASSYLEIMAHRPRGQRFSTSCELDADNDARRSNKDCCTVFQYHRPYATVAPACYGTRGALRAVVN